MGLGTTTPRSRPLPSPWGPAGRDRSSCTPGPAPAGATQEGEVLGKAGSPAPGGVAKAGRNHCPECRGRSPTLALCVDYTQGPAAPGVSPAVDGVARGSWSRVGGAACSRPRWSPRRLQRESLGAAPAAGKMLGPSLFTWVLLSATVTCAQAQQVPPVGELQPRRRWGCRCRHRRGGGRGRSCGGAVGSKGHTCSPAASGGDLRFGPAELGCKPGRSRFGALWKGSTF